MEAGAPTLGGEVRASVAEIAGVLSLATDIAMGNSSPARASAPSTWPERPSRRRPRHHDRDAFVVAERR
jgi:hypothetical protein